MPTVDKYAHGVPSWVDLSTGDIPGSLAFYSALFSWTSEDMGEQSGHYTMVMKDGHQVAAISPRDPSESGPPHWTTYVNVDDIDEVTTKVGQAGGQVLFGPAQVMSAGKMAVYVDPTGAAIAAWEPGDHLGAQLVNEAGSLIWNELSTSDPARAKEFYSHVFGWTWGGNPEYLEAQVDGRTVLGVMPRPDTLAPEIPDHWLVYFGVEDVDADAARAQELGAQLQFGPQDIPGTGRFAVLSDPHGGVFALFKG